MKIDYTKYPDIPEGCQMNLNRKTGVCQVFREGKQRSPWCKTRRESIGSISAQGVFTISKRYQLNQQLHHMQSSLQEEHAKSRMVAGKIQSIVEDSKIDVREERFISVPMPAILLAALMLSLTGETDCVSISDYLTRHRDFFSKYFANCHFESVSHDTIRRAFMLIEPERFESFYLRMLQPIIQSSIGRIIAADGQAVRATGKTTKEDNVLHAASMFMNVYDVENRVCIAQRLIKSKQNEISVGPQLLEGLDLFGSIVTADAMSCQVNFVKAITKTADYCISLKGNQERSWKEAIHVFNTTHPDQIASHTSEIELDHGRIEQRTVSMVPGSLLSKPLREKWIGLTGGAMVRVRSTVTKKSTNKTSCEDRYYITSMPAYASVAEKIGKVIRAHWGIENNLHWSLDNLFRQDRMQADNPNYISNRSSLNKLALALLENYRFHLWDKGEPKQLSLHLLQERCRDPKTAIECIGCALGWFE